MIKKIGASIPFHYLCTAFTKNPLTVSAFFMQITKEIRKKLYLCSTSA